MQTLPQSLAMSTQEPDEGPGAAAVVGDCSWPGTDIVMLGVFDTGELVMLPGEVLTPLAGTAGDV